MEYTFGLTFSRPWAVKRYFENFDKLELPLPLEAVVVVDTNDQQFYYNVQRELSRRSNRFTAGIKIYMTGNPPPFEKKRVHDRRLRVCKAMHIILTEARGEILLGAEDDSLPQPDAYKKLLDDLDEQDADFAQGTIVGRWDHIIPAWHVEEENGQLKIVRTGDKKTGLEEIQGVGWYCYVAKTDSMRSVPINWDLCKHIGPDFHMGYYMWKAGYKLLHDHDVYVTHFGEDFELTLDTKTIVREWRKIDDLWQTN